MNPCSHHEFAGVSGAVPCTRARVDSGSIEWQERSGLGWMDPGLSVVLWSFNIYKLLLIKEFEQLCNTISETFSPEEPVLYFCISDLIRLKMNPTT
ncbi:Hypothetical protein FKW44_004827 [Caligus rogercresseyi]|uniref:Uncharacterized protein n=1 Tax=Caligus rogercresseyi TaxID=217165 RepID=A0A7T8HMP5_CALRO|nr:Hypothetical protein FKW44_004827 [Caligus rogercresseyi]